MSVRLLEMMINVGARKRSAELRPEALQSIIVPPQTALDHLGYYVEIVAIAVSSTTRGVGGYLQTFPLITQLCACGPRHD